MWNIASNLTVTEMVIVWNFAVIFDIFGAGIVDTFEGKINNSNNNRNRHVGLEDYATQK
jgi:hypothetical protein